MVDTDRHPPIAQFARLTDVVGSTDNYPLSIAPTRPWVMVMATAKAVQSIAPAPMRAVQSIARAQPPSEVARYLIATRSCATQRAYRSDLRDFALWGGSVPCSPMTLAQYIAQRADRHKPATIARRVVGIGQAHKAHGFPDPTKSELVRAVIRGVKREHGTAQRQAAPLLLDDVLKMCRFFPDTKRGLRDRALILLGFAAALRRSELVGLDVCDLSVTSEGFQIRLQRSKTDQEGAGRVIAVPFARSRTCPVLAVQQWLESAAINEGPVFRSVGASGHVSSNRLSGQSVSVIVKAWTRAIALPHRTYSGHSLRSGLVTSAAAAGASFSKIREQTGHRSDAMLMRYLRTSNLFAGNAAGILL